MKKQKISVVIPCYNSAGTIEVVVEGVLKTIVTRNEQFNYEVVLVNDGSKDATWEVISNLARENEHLKAINFSKNYGQHSALMAGYRHVTGDIILGLDDDGEHNPEEMFKLIDKLLEGYDYVCADYRVNQSQFRSMGTRINNTMATMLINKPKDIDFTSYYVMRRFVVDEIIKYQQPYPYVGGLLLRTTRNIAAVPLVRQRRISGKSGYNLKKLLSLWLNGFTSFSVKPLRVTTLMGVFFAAIGFIFGIYTIINKIFINNEVPVGYSTMVSLLTFFSGIILMVLGMLGEYIGRIFISLNNSPQYVIKDVINLENDKGIK